MAHDALGGNEEREIPAFAPVGATAGKPRFAPGGATAGKPGSLRRRYGGQARVRAGGASASAETATADKTAGKPARAFDRPRHTHDGEGRPAGRLVKQPDRDFEKRDRNFQKRDRGRDSDGDGERVRLFVGAGRAAGVRPADLVGAITGEAGVPVARARRHRNRRQVLISGSAGRARRSHHRGAEGHKDPGKQGSRAQGEDNLIDQRLKIAVFIDFDNIEIGVKTTLHTQFDIAAILDGIKERGEVVTKIAYGDWKRAGDYGRLMSQHAIRMVQRNLTPGGDKNGADINLALDALEMAFTHDHINAFVIVGGDSDFITLVEKLKQYDKKVFVVGGRQFTSQVMQKNCHEFIAYENLVSRRPAAPGPGPRRETSVAATAADVAKAIPLVKRALKVLTDREVSPQLGLLKSTLLQLDSTFSERDYGVSTFRDFIEKVAKTGARHASSLGPQHDGGRRRNRRCDGTSQISQPRPPSCPLRIRRRRSSGAARQQAVPAPSVVDPEQIQQAVESTRNVFNRAAQPPRWPMYVRQLKQYIRGVDSAFDERKWGFATVMEFLRVCQREGLFRLERDRRGQIRVFPGTALQTASMSAGMPSQTTEEQRQEESYEAEPVASSDHEEISDAASAELAGQAALGDGGQAEFGVEESVVSEPNGNVMDTGDRRAPVRGRRTRKAPTAGKPPARKSTGARASTRRRKTPVRA